MELLDGKKVSNDIKDEIAIAVSDMKARGEKVPHLAAVIVGNDGASLTYVGSKVHATSCTAAARTQNLASSALLVVH